MSEPTSVSIIARIEPFLHKSGTPYQFARAHRDSLEAS